MPFTAQELADAGKVAIDFYVKNKPVDQVAVERPFLKKLMSKTKTFPGAKQYIVEQLRYQYASNFQWYYGAQSVTYNARNTVEQAQYAWRSAHDGFYLDEDRLTQNGIVLTDDNRGGQATKAEVMQLTNLLNENVEVLRLGFEEGLSRATLRDGSASTEDLEGLDHLVATDPTTGTVGGINRATSGNEYWRNNVNLSTAQSALITTIEQNWRACVRNGGMPDFIMAGSDFIDDLRAAVQASGEFQMKPNLQADVYDAVMHRQGVDSGLRIHGIPVLWNPEFSEIDALDSPTPTWEKRCYMINCKHIKLRPAEGHNMIGRTPPRMYNRYVHYWALTWKGGMTMDRSNAHAVIGLD